MANHPTTPIGQQCKAQIERQFGSLAPGAAEDMAGIEKNYLSQSALFTQEMIEGAALDPRRQQAVSQWLGAVAKAALDIGDFHVFYEALKAQQEYNYRVDTAVLTGGPRVPQTSPWAFGQSPPQFGTPQFGPNLAQSNALALLVLLLSAQATTGHRAE